MAEADTPQPPIDNIHNSINNEPDMPVQMPNEPQFHLPTMSMGEQIDTEMTEAPGQITFPPQQTTMPPNAPAQPQRTATPTRHVNGTAEVVPPMPSKAASHGAPARRYLNEKVTGVLLEGLKRLAADQPEEPLRVLGEFLLQKSRELEGTS
ncbi:hypothetical protein JMJ35_001776 [Cladonia borealis]|uniref:Dpy-30 domain-containing protein n=1 Tax=Cladonia borealis TaxID=184061 RepID=A0AA39V4I8_9LECA|nr:hypothetical protein JMJ35_001776 [Cladonia borealis]